jgi:hypothetical protein
MRYGGGSAFSAAILPAIGVLLAVKKAMHYDILDVLHVTLSIIRGQKMLTKRSGRGLQCNPTELQRLRNQAKSS